MDTLPSSVSTLTIPKHPPPPCSKYQYLRTPTTHQTQLSSNSKSSISNPRPTPSNNNLRLSCSSSCSSSHQSLSPCARQFVHQRAAAGYAAALVEVCRRSNTMEAAERDARRLARVMRNEQIRAVLADPLVVKEIVEKGRFQSRHVVALLKMMVERDRLGMVAEVLGQFRDICKHLRGGAVKKTADYL